MLDIPAREVAIAKGNVDENQVKRFDSVKFKPGPRKTLEETSTAIKGAYDSSSGFSGSLQYVPFFKDEIVEEDAPGILMP